MSSGSGDGAAATDFTFPSLPVPKAPPEKLPLTAQSTVTHAGADAGPPALSKPVQPVAALQEVKAVGRRNKVPLEKGFSQVDWLRLSRSAGLGLRKDIGMDEVRLHSRPDDAWMVLSGRVYNITPYMPFHPGGAEILAAAAGKDGTALFQRYHPWVNGHALLEACLLGAIKTNAGGRSPLGAASGAGAAAGGGSPTAGSSTAAGGTAAAGSSEAAGVSQPVAPGSTNDAASTVPGEGLRA